MHRVFALSIVTATALSAAAAIAQPPAGQPPIPTATPMAAQASESAPNGPRPIRESGPPAMFLKNKKGETIVVPSTTLEEFERLLQLERGISTAGPPRFTFADAIQLTGNVTSSVAEIQATFRVRFTPSNSQEDQWVRVPLRLNHAILTSAIEVEGTEEFQFDYQPNGDGHIVWLRSPQKSEAKLTVKFKVPVGSVNGEQQLVLNVPNRSTRLRLTVNSPEAEGRISDETSAHFAKNRTANGHTEFVIDGSGGMIQLFWRDAPEPPPVLHAEGNILVDLAGRSFDLEAQLRVRSYGPPIDSFTVRLPANVEWLGPSQLGLTGVQVAAVNPPNGGNRQSVTVRRLEGKTSSPIEVRLKAASKSASTGQAGPVSLSGFEVVGAQIQRGTIDVVLKGDLSVEWKLDANLRRVDVPEALTSQQIAARFEYDHQPYTLQAIVGKGDPRVSVEPTYLVTVESNQLKLDASLRYRIGGARTDKLLFEAGNWVIDRIAPAELLSGPWKADKYTIEIPLSSLATNGRGEFELQVFAHQTHEPPGLSWGVPFGPSNVPGLLCWQPFIGEPWIRHLANDLVAREVNFSLPRPIASAATPGVVIVSPADNVELTPVVDQLRWLVADALPLQVKLPTRQQPPLVYREDVINQSAAFAGVLKVRRQAISVGVENLVRVEQRELIVEQRMVFQIAFEPASRLTFDVPRALRDTGELEVLFDGNSLAMNPAGPKEASDSERQLVVVELREKQIGQCELLFRYRTPRLSASPDDPEITAALVRPVQSESTRIASSALRLSSSSDLRVSLVDDLTRPIEDETTGATVGNDLSFQLDQVPSHISIVSLSTETSGRRSTVIDRVWVQSLLTSTERRDRVCFRLSTNESRLDFTLPSGVGGEDVTVMIDGQRTDRFALPKARELRLNLDETFERRDLTIELWYWFTAQPAALGRLELQAPQLKGGSHPEQVFWEILLPANEHLVWAARNLVSENSWRRKGTFLARTPNHTQKDLEQWVQASHRNDNLGFNRYVFSSIGTRGSNTVVTALRPFATLVVTGIVFAIGVLLLYVPILRHPLLLFAFGSGFVAIAISFPEPCLVAGQLIAVGMSFVVLVRLLMAILTRHPAPRFSARGTTFSTSDPRSSNALPRRAESRMEASSGVGTATISAPLQMSASGNEP